MQGRPGGVSGGDAAGLLAGLDEVAVLSVVEAGLDRLQRAPLGGDVDDADVLAGTARLQRLENRIHAQKLRWLAETRERTAYRQAAARSAEDWLVRFGLTRAEAHAQVAATRVLAALPGTAAKAHAGDLGAGHLQAAARTLARLPDLADAAPNPAPDGADGADGADDEAGAGDAGQGDGAGDDHDVLRDAQPFDPRLDGGRDIPGGPGGPGPDPLDRARRDLDAFIAEQADGTDRSKLGRELDRFEHERGGDRLEERDRSGRARRKAWFAKLDGMRRLTIDLPDGDGQRVESNVRRLARRDGPADDRRPEQRLADAAVRPLTQPLDATTDPDDPDAAMAAMPGPGAQVLIVTSADAAAGDPDAQPACLDGVGPISPQALALACCDADTTAITTDAHGNVLHLGRSRRTITDRQRKALIVLDGGCVGCGADISRCQGHHVHWWEHGGRTDVCQLCLLCWDCHHNVHHNGWLTWRPPNGRYTVQPPHKPQPPGATLVDPCHRRRRR